MLDKPPKNKKPCISEEVAIIGMACVFPKAPDLKTFWQNIVSKVDAISDPPEDRHIDSVYEPDATDNDRIYCKRGGYLQELPLFNPLDFGVMPASIEGAEPEHFMALKVAHDALLDAGFPEKAFNRERTEVILGRGTFVNRGYITLLQHGFVLDQTIRLLGQLHPDYTSDELKDIKQKLKASLPPFNAQTAPGLAHSVMAGIIANRLDLKGLAVVVDAACASSLIALANAMQDLLSHKCDAALIGGVQISTPPVIHMLFTQLGALSHQPQLRPFDKNADGTMLGEGIGMMVLKRKTDAVRDGHRIYAVVRGVGASSDGKAKGLLAPRVEGEELALRRTYEDAGISPATIGLIEAHGTALPLGDATEMEALKRVFNENKPEHHRYALGTVKSMIGHLIPAAGIAGLIKAALAIYHKILPPTLNCETPHPEFDLEKSSFYINTETRPWIHASRKTPRRAGVNAFGFGGINTHAVLEEYIDGNEDEKRIYHSKWDTELFVFQSNSRKGLVKQCNRVQRYISQSGDAALVDIAFTLNNNPDRQQYCLSIVASSLEDLSKKISHAIERLQDPKRSKIKDRSGIYFFEKPLGRTGKLAFLFPGEGSQYVNMLSDLCLHFPEVTSCFDLLDRAFADHPNNYLPSQFIFPPTKKDQADAEQRIFRMQGAVDSVTTANRALFRLHRLLDIHPDALLGHSSGEFMALEASGAIGIDKEAELIEHIRAGNRMIEVLSDTKEISEGALLAVGGLDLNTVQQFVDKSNGSLWLAMDNCPHQFVLFGAKQAISETTSVLRQLGGICQILPFDRAYHTPLFEPALKSLQDFFNDLSIVSPQIPLYSCMTTGLYPQDPQEVRDLAVAQWARQVRFRETVETMYNDGVRIFLEIGPRANLTGFVNDILKRKNILAIASNVHHRSGITQLNHSLGLLAANGVPMCLDALYKRRTVRHLNLDLDMSEARPDAERHRNGLKLSLALPTLNLETSKTGYNQQHSAERVSAQTPAPLLKSEDQTARNSEMMNSTVITEYFKTMEQFLDMQHDVMQSYLMGKDLAGIRKFDPDVSNFKVNPDFAADNPNPKHAVATQSDAAGDSRQRTVVTEQTFPQTQNRSAHDDPADRSAAVAIDKAGLQQILLATMSEKTGYPADMIDLNSNLEADLGIDSIKRVEILEHVFQKIGPIQDDAMEELNTLKTLHEIVEFLTGHLIKSSDQDTQHPISEESSIGQEANKPAAAHSLSKPSALPFDRDVLRLVPDQEVVVSCKIDFEQDRFLQHHTLGGNVSQNDQTLLALPVLPLSMSLEMMAETAALMVSDKILIGIQNVKAHSWLLFEKPCLTFTISANAISESDGQFAVQLRIQGLNDIESDSPPALEATMIFSDAYPNPKAPATENSFLEADKVAALPKEKFYPSALFHGPSFQSVSEWKRSGRNGIEAVLEIPPSDQLFRHIPAPQFISDPVLIDAVGQVVGLWAGGYLEKNFVVFPVSIQEIQFFAPAMSPDARAVCRVRTHLEGQDHIRSEVNVVNSDGALQVKLKGLKHKRINMPRAFHLFRGSRDIMLSTAWPTPIEPFKENGAMACCRMDKIPIEFWEADNHVWRSVLAHIVLSRTEREAWHNLALSESNQTQWLLTHLVAKDAVRLLMNEYYGLNLWPADIEIQTDKTGRLSVAGNGLRQDKSALSLLIAHCGGVFVALAAESNNIFGAGIEIQPIRSADDPVQETNLSLDERNLISQLKLHDDSEWITRLLSAKEALLKAFDHSLSVNPQDVNVRKLDFKTGAVELEISEELSHAVDESKWNWIKAYTVREGDLIVACALIR